jgi:hypothetical protein
MAPIPVKNQFCLITVQILTHGTSRGTPAKRDPREMGSVSTTLITSDKDDF